MVITVIEKEATMVTTSVGFVEFDIRLGIWYSSCFQILS